MSYEKEIPLQKISPYIRYVNDIFFDQDYTEIQRIIYDHEFIFCIEGKAFMFYGGTEYIIETGDIFLLKPNIPNRLYTAGNTFHANCVHFDWVIEDEQYDFTAEQYYVHRNFSEEEKDFINRLTKRPIYEVSKGTIPTLIQGLPYQTAAPLFRKLYHHFQQRDSVSRLKERAIFLQLLAEIVTSQFTKFGVQKDHYHHNTISNAVAYMQDHYSERITTPLLAKRAGLSEKYFGRLFKSMTGLAVHEYLLNIRMQNAKIMLLQTNLDLSEIAEQIGVHDVFYFTKLFKKHEGITPGKYRRMLVF